MLVGYRFMPQMHLRQPYSACGPFTKIKKRIQKFKETGDSRYIYQRELYKILRDKANNVAKNGKCYGSQHRLALML